MVTEDERLRDTTVHLRTPLRARDGRDLGRRTTYTTAHFRTLLRARQVRFGSGALQRTLPDPFLSVDLLG